MSVSAPHDTLAYQLKGRPLTLKRNIEAAKVVDLSSRIRQFAMNNANDVRSEEHAVNFYLANHAMKELAFKFDMDEPLPDWAQIICNTYHEVTAQIALRAFYYLVLITAREARHNKNKHGMQSKIKNQFGSGAAMALLHYPDSADVHSVTQVFDTYAPEATVGEVCRSIVLSFYEGEYGSGYGGEAWGNVSDCMTNFVTGEYTAEMMLDTVWTLCHNGGPIFNKGMLYEHYDQTGLQQVLDIQRAGQIPRLVLSPYGKAVAAENYVTSWARDFAMMVASHLQSPDWQLNQPVDYAGLNALGALGDYSFLMTSLGKVVPPKQVMPVHAPTPIFKPTDKTHFIIAQQKGLMFKKITRKEVHA